MIRPTVNIVSITSGPRDESRFVTRETEGEKSPPGMIAVLREPRPHQHWCSEPANQRGPGIRGIVTGDTPFARRDPV
jgi:hypothetical protein